MRHDNRVDEERWFWSTEYGRDRMLREELETQAAEQASLRHQIGKDTRALRTQLSEVQGQLGQQVSGLTNAFLAYVELDDIRQRLEAFPGHAEARAVALRGIAQLLDGRLPPPVPDVPGYWVPAAIAAIGPDGSIDEDAAATARGRNAIADPFFAVARAAFGQPQPADLARILKPADGRWEPWQVHVWAAALHGAFGDHAVPTLAGTFAPLLTGRDDWQDWIASVSSAPTPEARLAWVNGQLASNDAPKTDTADDAPKADTAPAEPPVESSRGLLVQALQYLLGEGDPEEKALLEEARALEARFRNPLGGKGLEPPSPLKTGGEAVDLLRQCAVDPKVAADVRGWLWSQFAPGIRAAIAPLRQVPPAKRAEVPVTRLDGVVATANGLSDEAKFRRAVREIEAQAPSQLELSGPKIAIGGGVAAVLGLVLMIFFPDYAWVLLLGGIAVCVFGFRLHRSGTMKAAAVQYRIHALNAAAEAATSKAKKQDEANRAAEKFRKLQLERFDELT